MRLRACEGAHVRACGYVSVCTCVCACVREAAHVSVYACAARVGAHTCALAGACSRMSACAYVRVYMHA